MLRRAISRPIRLITLSVRFEHRLAHTPRFVSHRSIVMAPKYASEQPVGFVNHLRKVTVMGVRECPFARARASRSCVVARLLNELFFYVPAGFE